MCIIINDGESVKEYRTNLDTAMATIKTEFDTVKSDIRKQNGIILEFQQEVKATLQDFATKLYTLIYSTSEASTSRTGPRGETGS